MDTSAPQASPGQFPPTLWTQILRAGCDADPEAAAALERLARAYWPALNSWLRRQGVGEEEAADLTQSFFAHLIEKRVLGKVARDRGRFRTFLLTALRNHHRDLRSKAHAGKRGGGVAVASLDETDEDGSPLLQAADADAPDTEFDREWALTLLQRVAIRLRNEYEAAGKGGLFTHFQSFLYGDPDAASHAEAAARLGMSEGAVKVAGTRLRQRYQELIRTEIRQTVEADEDVEQELKELFVALAKRK